MVRYSIKFLEVTIFFSLLTICAFAQNSEINPTLNVKKHSDMITAQNRESTEISCKLTTPELQKRRKTVIASLKQKIHKTMELQNGYAFKFSGTGKILDELTTFIKTERECCNFFIFTLSISGDKSEIWLNITGTSNETKEFIANEIGFLD